MRTFEGLIGKVQQNAIESWCRIDKNIEIILFEDEGKTIYEYVAENQNITIIKTYERSFSGVPLLDSMYKIVNQIAKHQIICYLTADILLPVNFGQQLLNLTEVCKTYFTEFVGISSRYDLLDQSLKRVDKEDITNYYQRCKDVCKKRVRSGIDLWVTQKNQKIEYLPFPIGRCLTDNWFVWECKNQKIPIVDISEEFIIIHQNHDKPSKSSKFFELEKYICHHIFPKASVRGGDIHDSDFVYENGRLTRPKGLRLIQLKLFHNPIYRFLLSIYRMLRIKYYRVELWR